MSSLFLRDVVVPGPGTRGAPDGRRVGVLVRDGTIVEIGPDLRPAGEVEVVEGNGGALLPGLHDHHIHLLAAAAARDSVAVGPADVVDAGGLAGALRRADAASAPGRWLRAVGYHETVAGDLDREALDALVAHRPVRLQHRTGMLWVLNTAALEALGVDVSTTDGRFFRADDWLRDQLRLTGQGDGPDLAGLGAELARMGITGVTDATPFTDASGPALLAEAATVGHLPQHVTVTGGVELADTGLAEPLARGPVKLVVDDDRSTFDRLVADISRAHGCGRPVAVHCVTRAALVLVLTAWGDAGGRIGDRIEHGSVIPEELIPEIADRALTVVTQPGLVSERGDQYLSEVDPDDVPHLYRLRSLLAAGVPVAASSDAPYTAADPWAAMRAAVTRRAPSGVAVGPAEALGVDRALGLYLGSADRPGGPSRRVEVGAAADLCLLTGPVPDRAGGLRSDLVAATVVRGRRIH